MSWAGLANNQCVSNANLDNAITTAVFVRKSSFSDTNQELTKERAQQYVYLNENLASFLAKALNQLVVKQDLQAATIIGCGTGTYETIQWTANTLIITTAYFNVGTTSGTLTIDYTVVSGTASIRVIYGGTTSTITGLVSTSGSATYTYTYDAGVGTTIGITFDTRQNSGVTQNFSVRTSCAATTTTTTSTTTTTTTVAAVTIDINNNSLDIPITGMTINGSSVTYVSGTNFTINAGNSGTFSSTQTGTQDVSITYSSNVGGQNIVFTDSNSNSTCHDANSGGGTFTITGATITGGTTIYVTASDGTCF